jgi:hypothetical protein
MNQMENLKAKKNIHTRFHFKCALTFAPSIYIQTIYVEVMSKAICAVCHEPSFHSLANKQSGKQGQVSIPRNLPAAMR